MRQTVDEWEKTNKKFICTRAYYDVLAKLDSNSCVAVTGPGGAGKSAIVQTVSLSLMTKYGYEITILEYPIDLRNFYKPGRKTVFVIDDVCGKFTAREEQINNWYSIQHLVKKVTADKSCKILFSCRLQVFKDPKFSSLKAFTSCECNITSPNLCLTNVEKEDIFKSHLTSENFSRKILSSVNDSFPLLCQLRSIGKNDLDIVKYFDTPYQVYEEELDALKLQGKEKLCGLCLCIMFNNQLSESIFENPTKKFRKKINDIRDSLEIDQQIMTHRLRTELDILQKTYVIKHEGLYKICHDALFDFMAFYFGRLMKRCFIHNANSGFLRERFLWINAFDIKSVEYNIENIVHLEDTYLESYIDRIISDWKSGRVSDALYNINMKSNSFRTKFLEPLKRLSPKIAMPLSQKKDDFREDYASGNTPLIISCLGGYVDLLKWLLEHKANVNDCRSDGSSALYMACAHKHVEIVNMLLHKNVDVNLCTKEGVSPLGIACYYTGDLKIVSALLKNNAKVNEYRFKKNNMTPLFMACEQNYVNIVRILLSYGADPNICLHNGMSALLKACQNECKDMVNLLIENDANTNTAMKDGDTPLFSASYMGLESITKILLENKADPYKGLHSKEEIHKSLKGTSDTLEDKKDLWFETVEELGSRRVKSYILTKSADYVFDVFAGSSPLHVACFMGHIKVVELLIEKDGRNIDNVKTDGTTPLFYACELGHYEIVRLLLEKGADKNSKRNDEKTPLNIAEINCHADIVSLMTSV